MENVFHFYQTNEPNLLGGLMTYSTLDEAMSQIGKRSCFGEITTVYCVVLVNSRWWHGKETGTLYEEISRGVVYKKN